MILRQEAACYNVTMMMIDVCACLVQTGPIFWDLGIVSGLASLPAGNRPACHMLPAIAIGYSAPPWDTPDTTAAVEEGVEAM